MLAFDFASDLLNVKAVAIVATLASFAVQLQNEPDVRQVLWQVAKLTLGSDWQIRAVNYQIQHLCLELFSLCSIIHIDQQHLKGA